MKAAPFPRVRWIAGLLLTGLLFAACSGGEPKTVIRSTGSDTLFRAATAWSESYRAVEPSVEVLVSRGGTDTGIAALLNGTVDIANASRAIRERELEMARSNKRVPEQHLVGRDALAIFLHPNNPLSRIGLDQLAEIFGDGGKIARWTDLGVEVPACQGQEITLVGRQTSSGTHTYFRDTVLKGNDLKLGTRILRGSSDVILAVEQEPCAIAYGSLAHATEKVKLACLSPAPDSACVMPSIDSAANGSYPISRPLFLYTNGMPQGQVGKYIDWIKSSEGQCIILKAGYAPVVRSPCNRP